MKAMNKFLALAATAMLAAPAANATAIPFDFTTLGGENTPLASSVTVNGVTADGFVGGFGTTANLWLRNATNDHGLGVCSEGTAACSAGGGDVNELDNQGNVGGGVEAIRLSHNIAGGKWTSLWVSSLDSDNKDGNVEYGTLLWSDCATFNGCQTGVGMFTFKYGDFGTSFEGDVLTLAAAAGFNPDAKYLLFIPSGPGVNGYDNDYLVWKGVVSTVPEPATIGLLGLGLAGLGLGVRRRGSR